MDALPLSPVNSRYGFAYYPDALHYRHSDLEHWLPVMQTLGAGWLILQAPAERAIPEDFLRGLLDAGIQPVPHFKMPLGNAAPVEALEPIIQAYARWGVSYLALYDRPNCRSAWLPAAWARAELVERFLDHFLPLAELSVQAGMAPVFAPLEPGGDYWDLAFLQAALTGLCRRADSRLLKKLVLGAYAWCQGRSLDWGAGGPDRWAPARPYGRVLAPSAEAGLGPELSTAPDEQDQRGFRVFDWYLALARQGLGQALPVMLLGAGCRPEDVRQADAAQPDWLAHAQANLSIARLAAGEDLLPEGIAPLPAEVMAANFWLLTAAAGDPQAAAAWFQPDGVLLPAVEALRRWTAGRRQPAGVKPAPEPLPAPGGAPAEPPSSEPGPALPQAGGRPIAHYVLLPLYAWGAPEWDLAALQPILDQSHPTIGFSLVEACLAGRVTVVGGHGAISDDALEMLRKSGCQVERIQEDGTLVAP